MSDVPYFEVNSDSTDFNLFASGPIVDTDAFYKRLYEFIYANLNSTYKSGLRYTPYYQNGVEPNGRPIYEPDELNPFSKLGAAWWNTDLKITKDIIIKRGQQISLSIEFKNIFDNKNAAIINPITGKAYEYGDPLPNTYRDPMYPDPQDNGVPPFNPARFLTPRQVLAGISWQF